MAFKRVTAKVDLDAIRHNYNAIRQKLPAKVKMMGVIKADAYGHGALPVARELVEQGIDMFGVATIEEGISLRKNGVQTPILILGFTGREDYPALLTFDLARKLTKQRRGLAGRPKSILRPIPVWGGWALPLIRIP